MGDAPLAAMGVVVQWSSGVVLFLLFLRLGRSGVPRSLVNLWLAVWAAQIVSVTGSLVHAIGVLIGNQAFGAGAVRWLDLLSIPGTLSFAVLAAFGALMAVERLFTVRLVRGVILAVIVAGVAIASIDIPTVIGSVVCATTVVVFFGSAFTIARAERRERPQRFPLLAATMVVVGVVTLVYQGGAYFGRVLWPVDDFGAVVGWSAGYAGALTSMILAGALVTLIVDGAFGATVATRNNAGRESLLSPMVSFDVGDRMLDATIEETTWAPPVAVPSVAIPENPPAASEAPLGTSPIHPRTVTLPRPPVHPNGSLAEVLLVDDEAAVRSTLARIFQRGGWPVRDMSTGEEALAWLLDVAADAAPAVILCDFKMPGMGGRELYAHMLQERPELLSRIVFVTGDASRESARAFSTSPPCPLVEKPFTVSEIASAVEQVLAGPPRATG